MRAVLWPVLLFPVLAMAAPQVSCVLERNGHETVMSVPAQADALGGVSAETGRFKLRAVLAAPAGRGAWLLVESYAKAADGDYRILSSQKVLAPFTTGRMEVVEPTLGRSLRYECMETK